MKASEHAQAFRDAAKAIEPHADRYPAMKLVMAGLLVVAEAYDRLAAQDKARAARCTCAMGNPGLKPGCPVHDPLGSGSQGE